MEDFEVAEIIGEDTLPIIGRNSRKQPLLTVFQNRAVFNKAAELAFDLNLSSKILLLTGTNQRMYICLNCGEYTGGFKLNRCSNMLLFGSVKESRHWATMYKMPTETKEFQKFSFVISTETKSKSVTDNFTGKTLSLDFRELTLIEKPQVVNTRPYIAANYTQNGQTAKQVVQNLNNLAHESMVG